MKVTWHLCDLKTGRVIAELPIAPSGELEKTVSVATTCTVNLLVRDQKCPTNWADLLDPMSVMLVPAFGDDLHLAVGYYIDDFEAGGPTVPITLRSLEGIPDEVNVRDHDFYDGDDEAGVAAALLMDVVVPSFGFDVVFTPTGQSGDHTYSYFEDRSVKAALDDLAQAEGGPEWTVQLAWEDEKHQRVLKRFEIGPRVGSQTPGTVFENKHLAEPRKRRSGFSRGQRATHFVATSDGSGADRPMSTPAIDTAALAAGVPQWEARGSYSGIDEDAQLDRIAAAGLSRRRRGVTTFAFPLNVNAPGCPVLGRDFQAGDVVTLDSVAIPDDPAVWKGPARIIGWRAQVTGGRVDTITPAFWSDPHEEGA